MENESAETIDSVKTLPKTQDGNTTSLPSPPSSVKATELDNERNADGSLSATFDGSASFLGAHGGASTGISKTATVIGLEADCQIS